MSLASEIQEAVECGSFVAIFRQLVAVSDEEKRNAVALIMLHAAASNYSLDVPRAVETAFKLADGYMRKCAKGPTDTNICAECGKSVSEDDTVWIDPVTTKATMTGKPYHVGCAPAQKE